MSHVVENIHQKIPSQVVSVYHSATLNSQITIQDLLYESFENTLFIAIPFLKKSL